jgi:predicted DNA-binding protein (MmcQ/YjbR family)
MVSITTFRKTANSFDQVSEEPHFHKTSFRVKGKIFATLDTVTKQATLKLSAADQSVYCLMRPSFANVATGAWGKQGWTLINLTKAPKQIVTEALQKAYAQVIPKANPKKVPSAKVEEKIQTLHPDKTKTNKRIAISKYHFIKDALLGILAKRDLTHTELMESLYQQVKNNFDGAVQWYGETVKLDLEARKIIKRTEDTPQKYRLVSKKPWQYRPNNL